MGLCLLLLRQQQRDAAGRHPPTGRVRRLAKNRRTGRDGRLAGRSASACDDTARRRYLYRGARRRAAATACWTSRLAGGRLAPYTSNISLNATPYVAVLALISPQLVRTFVRRTGGKTCLPARGRI